MDIHTAIQASSTPEVTNAVLTSICSLILTTTGSAAWTDFQSAFDAMEPGSVAKKDVEAAYHWVAARTHGPWSTGGAMSPGERSQWQAWSTPFIF